jgi:hypothetical protein
MLEAVIVLPLVVVLFAASSYFATAYAVRIESQSTARAVAWAHALGGCEEDERWARSEPTTLDQLDQQGVEVPRQLDRYGLAAGAESVVESGARTSVLVSRTVRGPLSLPLPTAAVTTRFQLPCDERPQRGDPAGVLRYGWRTIRFW